MTKSPAASHRANVKGVVLVAVAHVAVDEAASCPKVLADEVALALSVDPRQLHGTLALDVSHEVISSMTQLTLTSASQRQCSGRSAVRRPEDLVAAKRGCEPLDRRVPWPGFGERGPAPLALVDGYFRSS